MPTPIPFSVTAKQRQGTFQSSTMTFPAGYSQISWNLDIPHTADYENTANSVTCNLLCDPTGGANLQTIATDTWVGGRFVSRTGVVDPPPPQSFDLSTLPAGASLAVQFVVPNSMDVGLSNGVIS